MGCGKTLAEEESRVLAKQMDAIERETAIALLVKAGMVRSNKRKNNSGAAGRRAKAGQRLDGKDGDGKWGICRGWGGGKGRG
jgi:hypothetical protein